MKLIVIGNYEGIEGSTLTWEDGELTSDDWRIPLEAQAAVDVGLSVAFPGWGGGPASLNKDAPPHIILATMAEPFDGPVEVEGDLPDPKLPPGAIA